MPLDAKKSLSYHVPQVDLDSNDEEMRDVQQQTQGTRSYS